MDNTVTYMGPSGVLIHAGPTGIKRMFHKRQPLVVDDEADIEFYRGKEAKGSPFRVHPKLEYIAEPIFKKPLEEDAILLKPRTVKPKAKKTKKSKVAPRGIVSNG